MRILRWFLCLAFVLGLASGVRAQAVNIQTPEQLQKLVAPVALYNDQLLACVLTAATLPSELSQAATFVAANPGPLTAMPDNDWDPAVKSLLGFPTVLTMMTTKSSWTRKLGQAVLAQQQDVLAAIQAYRSMLSKSGALDSSTYQAVNTSGTSVVITPTDPNTIYVPTYSIEEYDYYRPVLSWGAGVAVGAWWGYRNFNWTTNTISVYPDRIAAYNYGPKSQYAALGQDTAGVWTPSQAATSAYASYRAATGTPGSAPLTNRPGEAAPLPPAAAPQDSGMQGSANDWSSAWDYGGTSYGGYGYGYGYGAVAPGVTAARVNAWAGANAGSFDNAAGARGSASRGMGGGFGGGRRR